MLRGAWFEDAALHDRLEALVHVFDESVPRIAKLPALASEGDRAVASPLYAARVGGVLAGEERFAIDRRKSGARVLFAQAVYDEVDAGSMQIELREELDANGKLVAVTLRRDSFFGAIDARFAVEKGRLHGEVRAKWGDTLAVDEAIADALFVATPAGSWQLAIDRATGLAIGKQMTLGFKDIDIEPELRLVDVSETVKRIADDHGMRRYVIDEKRANGATHAEVVVGKDGAIVSAHAALQIGEIDLAAR
jgi:hypothetical protein